MLYAYGELLKEANGGFTATLADTQALRRIAKDTRKTMTERVHAHIVRGRSLWAQGNVEESIKAHRAALELEADATPDERAALVPRMSVDAELEWEPAAQFLKGELEETREWLARLGAAWGAVG